MKKISKHLPHYFSLFGIFIFALFGFLLFPNDIAFQMAVIVSVGAAYVAWGIVHHSIHRDLHLSVIVEYLAVAIIGVVTVLSLLLEK